MRLSVRAAIVASAIVAGAPVLAGTYYCGSQPTTARTCPDGSIPIYRADDLSAPRQSSPEPQARDDRRPDAGAGSLLGKWRTNVPTSVISRENLTGQRWTEIFPGAASGDLMIKPDGTYAWASYGGKVGRWVAGDRDWPIVLIDTVENRRWKVGFDERSGGRRIYIWDGNSITYNGSR